MASVPSGTSVAAGPVTEICTEVIRVGSPGTTASLTTAGSDLRSIVTVIVGEKNPSAAAALRVSSVASRISRSRSSSVISA